MAEILIAGAGIGGLTAALSLHAAGFGDILIAEAAARPRPAGVGLNILPNAVRELAALGLFDELSAHAVHTGELRLLTRQGTLIWSEPRGTAAGYWWPQLSVRRGVLQQALLNAVRARLGANTVLTGSRVLDLAQDGSKVTVTVGRPAGGLVSQLAARAVIGADGIRSAVRSALHPAEAEPRWNGWVMWRGAALTPRHMDGKTMIVAGDSRLRIVAYPVAPPTPAGILVNWVVACPAPGPPAHPGDWDQACGRARALEACAGCGLDIAALIRRTNLVLEYPMVDRDPLPRWTRGRITLLGDAAHPMYPAGSNGATQAIIDARALAYRLAAAGNPERGLAAYERDRRPAVTRVQLASRQMGPEAVIDLAHARAPGGFSDIEQVISRRELSRVSRRYAQVSGCAMAAVNRPSPYDLRPGPGGQAPGHREAVGSIPAGRAGPGAGHG